jgi:myo-inositol-1(or 4)-monophosphatase
MLSPENVSVAIAAALHAGRVLREKLDTVRDIRHKGFRDIVTDADVAAQAVVVRRLRRALGRDVLILAEEGIGLELRQRAVKAPVWVIDPLDGTSNYARGFPIFAVSIGLVVGGRAVLGVIFDPLRNELFVGEAGRGATLRVGSRAPVPLAVSRVARVGQAMIGSGWPRDGAPLRRMQASIRTLVGHCQKVRTHGSAALNLAYVAAGRLDAAAHLDIQPWDMAAGVALIEAAGGRVTTPHGRRWSLAATGLLATNRLLHAPLRRILNWAEDAGRKTAV